MDTPDQTDRPVSATDLKLCYDCVLVLQHNSLVVNPAADVEDAGRQAAGDQEGGEPGGGEREEEAGEAEQVGDHPVSQSSSKGMVEAAADPLEDPTPTLSSLIGHTSRDTRLLLIQTRRRTGGYDVVSWYSGPGMSFLGSNKELCIILQIFHPLKRVVIF